MCNSNRWSGKKFHLTYPQTEDLNPSDFLLHIESLLTNRLEDYLIVSARHNGDGFHHHVYFTLKASFRLDIRNPFFFDLNCKGRKFHCNIQVVGTGKKERRKLLDYLLNQQESMETNISESELYPKPERKLPPTKELLDLCIKRDWEIDDLILYLSQNYEDELDSLTRVRKNVGLVLNLRRAPKVISTYSLRMPHYNY